jgi:hypothetical protein
MRTRIAMLAIAALAYGVPAYAQESGGNLYETLRKVWQLPEVTREARQLGVPESDIRAIFNTARERRVPAGELTEIWIGENASIREHGPVDNFGAFVQERLRQGLRGRDLAAAIRAEHAARGKGKGAIKNPNASVGGRGRGHGSGGDDDDDRGRSGDHDDDDDKGSDDRGRSDKAPGKSGNAGKKGGS